MDHGVIKGIVPRAVVGFQSREVVGPAPGGRQSANGHVLSGCFTEEVWASGLGSFVFRLKGAEIKGSGFSPTAEVGGPSPKLNKVSSTWRRTQESSPNVREQHVPEVEKPFCFRVPFLTPNSRKRVP